MRDFKIYLSVGIVVLAICLTGQYYAPEPVDWTPTFRDKDKIPFGTAILHDRIPDLFGGSSAVRVNELPYNHLKKSAAPATYILIAGRIDLSAEDAAMLNVFMYRGGNVFIAAADFGKLLSSKFKLRTGSEWTPAKPEDPVLSFTEPALKDRSLRIDKQAGAGFFSRYDSSGAIKLGINSAGHANLLCYRFGKGSLTLSPNPKLFSNYAMLYPRGDRYIAAAFSHLPPLSGLYWDTYFTRDPNLIDLSPMQVIFRYPALKMAYLIAVFSLLVFVIFALKRRQRIIPVADPLKNTTAEFVQVVGQLYYEQRDNKNIAVKNILYLLEHIRSKYRLGAIDADADLTELLSSRSGLGRQRAAELANSIGSIRASDSVSDHELLRINQLIEEFYRDL